MKYKNWQIKSKQKKDSKDIVDILLKNRDLTTKLQRQEFFNPKHPKDFSFKDLGIKSSEVKKAIARVKKAIENQEKVIVYGDYDADGICATAIMWEALWSVGVDALPFIPDRFVEGYGFNDEAVLKLCKKHPNLALVITVDNGIVAGEKIKKVQKQGIDVIVTDHHEEDKKLPPAAAVIHTKAISGSAVAWVLAQEIRKQIKKARDGQLGNGLDLVAIGTIADQMPVVGIPRSFIKHGLDALNKTQRVGLLAMFNKAGINGRKLGMYEVNFVIAPRINAMGRLEHGIDSLRLLCTNSVAKAQHLAKLVNSVNIKRQQVVDDVLAKARQEVISNSNDSQKVIILAHESYHEGVIGLAASKLVEEFYRPSIVLSIKGDVAKASARSIYGFNIIESIRSVGGELLLEGGGHAMAAGFSIKTEDIEVFKKRLSKTADKLLTDDVLAKMLKADLEVDLVYVSEQLAERLEDFAPFGIGNPEPVFVTRNVAILSLQLVGRDKTHLKLEVANKDGGRMFPAIGFGMGEYLGNIKQEGLYDIAYALHIDEWNGQRKVNLIVKDIRSSKKY